MAGVQPRTFPQSRRRVQFNARIRRIHTGIFTKQQRKNIHRMINAAKETQYFDTIPSDGAEVNLTGTLTQLTTITQGDGSQQRLGNKIMLGGLRYTGWYVSESTAAADTIHAIRTLIFRWKPDTAVDTPTLAKLFEETNDNQSFLIGDRESRNKFDVIYDKLRVFGSRQSTGGQGDMTLIHPHYITINKKMRFAEEATTGTGHLYILEWGNNSSGAECILANSRIRVFYKNMQ